MLTQMRIARDSEARGSCSEALGNTDSEADGCLLTQTLVDADSKALVDADSEADVLAG